jgi:hypothetical protein
MPSLEYQALVAAGLAATVLLWLAAAARHRVAWLAVRDGLRNGVLVALVLGASVALLLTVMTAGRPLLFEGNVTLAGALALGSLAGLSLAIGFLWLGLALMPIGLILRAGDGWPRYGTWIAVPVIVASFGLALGAFNAARQEGLQPALSAGTVQLELSGEGLGTVALTATADCQLQPNGALTVEAGTSITAAPPTTADGRPVTVQMSMAADGSNLALALTVGRLATYSGNGWQPGPDTTVLSGGWTPAAGQLTLTGIVPLDVNRAAPDPVERWSGSLSWTCSGQGSGASSDAAR